MIELPRRDEAAIRVWLAWGGLLLRPQSGGRDIKRQHVTGIWSFRGPRGFILKRTRAQAAQAVYGGR